MSVISFIVLKIRHNLMLWGGFRFHARGGK